VSKINDTQSCLVKWDMHHKSLNQNGNKKIKTDKAILGENGYYIHRFEKDLKISKFFSFRSVDVMMLSSQIPPPPPSLSITWEAFMLETSNVV